MKKSNVIAIALAVLVAICVTVIVMRFTLSKSVENPHEQYVSHGRYYTNGVVVTDDGNEWNYTAEIISEKEVYDEEPVYIVMDDNGTSENITDDIILGLVKDVNTAIYDTLETELSDSFEIERNGNKINITAHK